MQFAGPKDAVWLILNGIQKSKMEIPVCVLDGGKRQMSDANRELFWNLWDENPGGRDW
jgi:hypothetical protein